MKEVLSHPHPILSFYLIIKKKNLNLIYLFIYLFIFILILILILVIHSNNKSKIQQRSFNTVFQTKLSHDIS